MCDHALAHASMQDYGQPYGCNLHPDLRRRIAIAIMEAKEYQGRELTDAEKAEISNNVKATW